MKGDYYGMDRAMATEWIEWKGGERPVGKNIAVDYRLRDGKVYKNDPAGHLYWPHDKETYDIVAYRLSEQQSMEEAYDETHKEIRDSEYDGGALGTQISGNHYLGFKIQPVEFVNANDMDFLQGSVIKYISRHKLKGKQKDVEKAIHFCKLILELQYKEGK